MVRPTLKRYSACWSSYVRLLSLLVGLIQEFHALAVKTAPVMAVKEKMQGLSEDPRKLLEKLLKLFAQVCMYAYGVFSLTTHHQICINNFVNLGSKDYSNRCVS